MKRGFLTLVGFVALTGIVLAQYRDGHKTGQSPKTARDMPSHENGTPMWENPRPFGKDVFTFARIKYSSGTMRGFTGSGWDTDAPDSDLNLSYRLQQMTTIRVNPDGRFIDLTDPELANFPWIYIVEPGSLYFTDDEVMALRAYLNNGGFLMFDDFWGDSEWKNMEYYMRQVLPRRHFVDLPLDHPLYHCVFQIDSKGQIPNSETGKDSQYTGVTWEFNHDGDVKTVHHRAILDDKGRIMVLATHNTDNGDGWESEGENDYFFRTFSEKIAYPLGINIIFYVMTH